MENSILERPPQVRISSHRFLLPTTEYTDQVRLPSRTINVPMPVKSLPADKPKIVFHAAMMSIQNFGFFMMYLAAWALQPPSDGELGTIELEGSSCDCSSGDLDSTSRPPLKDVHIGSQPGSVLGDAIRVRVHVDVLLLGGLPLRRHGLRRLHRRQLHVRVLLDRARDSGRRRLHELHLPRANRAL